MVLVIHWKQAAPETGTIHERNFVNPLQLRLVYRSIDASEDDDFSDSRWLPRNMMAPESRMALRGI